MVMIQFGKYDNYMLFIIFILLIIYILESEFSHLKPIERFNNYNNINNRNKNNNKKNHKKEINKENKKEIYKGNKKEINNQILLLKVAENEQERKKGLMFIKKMKWREGMLFDYKKSGYHSVWMKNTFIPLDVLFLDTNFTIIDYVENNIPHNLNSISTIKPSRYIVEVNAGVIKKMKFKKGDTLRFKIIKKFS